MYKEDLALNNRKWLICHKTKPKKTITLYEMPLLVKSTANICTKYLTLSVS